jgi:hypothetical protein
LRFINRVVGAENRIALLTLEIHMNAMTTRRTLLLAMGALPFTSFAQLRKEPVEVWKDPSCGCCKQWVTHLEQNGFAVTVHETGNAAVRAKLGIPQKLGSCHTAVVGGYALEGHVPAQEVRRLLKERPAALGLAVPGMPVGGPGMDAPAYKGRRDPYDVLLVLRSGDVRVYASYNKG